MTILHISDTHGMHHRLAPLPEAELLVHTGDITENGTEAEVLDFLNWLIPLPYIHKIFLAGNHDFCLLDATAIEDLPDNIHFLHNSGVTIDGTRFYGVEYNNPQIDETLPVDVLVSHEPPLGILDFSDNRHWGSATLLGIVGECRPKLHLFGHVHARNGEYRSASTCFSNASMAHPGSTPRLFTL